MSAAANDSMGSPPAKRPRPAFSGFIRLCDAFVRGDAGVICPIGIAEESVRVAFKLQRELLETALNETGRRTGLRLGPPEWIPVDIDQKNDGNIFIPYDAEEEVNGETFKEQFRAQSEAEKLKVKNYLLDILPSKSTIRQPVISERDFNQYKMQLCCKNLLDLARRLPSAGLEENNDLFIASKNIKSQLEDLKENRIKIGVLSQNARGKSFILNLLFLLTADTDNDYMNNNKNMILPKDIQEDPTIEELKDKEIQTLPRVVQDVITKIRKNETNQDNKQHFKKFTDALVHELGFPSEEDIKRSKDSFSKLKDYYLMDKRITVDSYVLPQKEMHESYDSTTKCVMHLRYGPLYQLKIEYFKAEDLQYQLFELQSLIDGTSEENHDIYPERNGRSCECLKARLALLTDFNGDGNDDDDDEIDDEKIQHFVQTWNRAEDVKLSDDVEAFAGKTELHIGNGKNATNDRLALKAVLIQLITSQGKDENAMQNFKKKLAAVKKIVVYLPAKILIGKEILEMPGMESDPMAIHCINNALEKVDVLFLLSENAFNIGENEVQEIFVESKFLKNMLNDPVNYKLMLLSYPEKQNSWDLKKIANEQEMWKHEERKRNKEIKALHKLIADKTLLSKLNEDSIITSNIFPLMYTSLYSQEGEPRDIIESNSTIEKLTGITALILQLDTLSAKKQENPVLEATGQLEAKEGLPFENADNVVSCWKKKEINSIHEVQLERDNESALIRVKKDLENILHDFVEKKISDMLTRSEAKERWLENEHRITKIAMFNPYYCGKHPRFNVNIYNILFGDLTDSAEPLFTTLMEDLNEALSTYQKDAIKVCVVRLVAISQATDKSTEQFVEKAVNGLLEDAKVWYMGKTRLPINAQKLGKYLDESLKIGLKEAILKPACGTSDLSEAKTMVTSKIKKATDYAKQHFLDILINVLHKKRFKSFSGKLKNKNGTWRTWQRLIAKCNMITKNKEVNIQNGEFRKAITLMSTSLHDVPQCGP